MTVRSQREDNDIPVATQAVSLRYAGLPSTVTLPVPSKHGFIAMKCLAYRDRHAPRDLSASRISRSSSIRRQSGSSPPCPVPTSPSEFTSLPPEIAARQQDQLLTKPAD